MATPKMLRGIVVKDIRYDLQGSVNEVLTSISRSRDEAVKNGFSELYIDLDAYDDYGSPSLDAFLKGSRIETAEEAILREGAEKQREKFLEDQERKQFEALKKKYG